ncbi:hypothetical protein HDV57DRAFT_508110 [Trichoderma longibrachiatum]
MLRASKDLDLLVDFALGPTQGASIPILDPDSLGMNTELAYGSITLASGQVFNGEVPPPGRTDAGYANKPDFIAPFTNFTNKFVAAVIARKSKVPSKDPRVVQLDFDSVIDVTHSVTDGKLHYTAPKDKASYILFAFYQRRTGYLAAQGAFNNATDARNPASWFAYVTGFTEQYMMNGENGFLLRQLGLYAWEDSAEFRATLFWTDELSSYFRKTRGYDITLALPALFRTNGLPPSTLANGYFYFAFNSQANGTDISWKLRNDYYQCLQELYKQYHLEAAHINAPETESNYFDGVIDAFRAMGGGAMMGRKQIFSSELRAHRYKSYAITWPVILNDCKISYAGGVNRIVTHGFPYSGLRPEVEWPGLTTFEWLYSEMWGPRQPSWSHVKEMGDWIARTQLILQSGVPRIDVGIYRHKYLSVDIKHYNMAENIFWDRSLQNAGYSYVADNAVITNGFLAESGPGFSAFVVDNSTNITSEALDKFQEYASHGFPILFVGSIPETTPYYCDLCDQRVKQGIQDLLKHPSVKTLHSENEVVDALAALNVQPAAENLTPAPILYVHRIDKDNDVDYYWVYNSDIYEDHATEASIRGKGIPYTLDAWTGAIAPVVNYTTSGDRFNVWIELRSNQSTILAFAPHGFFKGVRVPDVHVAETNVEYLSYDASSHSIIARSISRGEKRITLSDGRVFTLSGLGQQATTSEIGPWNVTIQDWLPNPDRFRNYTSTYQYHTLELESLVPWYNITGLNNTSGVGTYTSWFAWRPQDGALLDLGPVFNTVRLWINGEWTGPVDVTDAIVDITPYLKHGVNDVKVEVTSTLRNRLLQVNVTQSWEQSQYAASYGGQPYGLTAPVRLIPFTEKRIRL